MKNWFIRNKSNVKPVVVQKQGAKEDVVAKVVAVAEKEYGDKALTVLAGTLRRAVSVSPNARSAVQRQVVSSIKSDIGYELKADPTGESLRSLWKKALATPEYVALLRDIKLAETDVQLWIDTAIEEAQSPVKLEAGGK